MNLGGQDSEKKTEGRIVSFQVAEAFDFRFTFTVDKIFW